MNNKKAVELSMNLFVVIVLSLVVFGFGISFFWKGRDISYEILNMKFDELNTKVEDLLCQTSDKTCIGINERRTYIGQ